MRKEIIGNFELYQGDCRDVLPEINGVHAVITSPPYDGLRTYGVKGSSPSDHIEPLAACIADGGIIMWNVADQVVNGSESGTSNHFTGIKDWKNKWGGSLMHGTDRQPDGRTTRINGMGRPVENYGLRRNWWVIANPYIGETDGHPAPMPYRMASDHIETWTVPSETVLDPYLGSGTSGVAATKLGRRFVGIEIDPKYFDIACRRIEESARQPDMLVQVS